MKQLSPLLTLLLLVVLFSTSCKKKDVAPIDQLPALTTEGKNTFGCLVNGEVFKPKGSMFAGPKLECFYQFVDGEYHFGLSASMDEKESCELYVIYVFNDGSAIEEGKTYKLKTRTESSSASGMYTAANSQCKDPAIVYETNELADGELKIIHFELEKQIVSGTFWFDAVNDKGEKVEVREGRFDMQFTR